MQKTVFKKEDFDRVWFTSDHHFGHENIIKYCKRPFSTIEEMDEKLIEKWNRVIRPNDIVYHLGDFSLQKNTLQYFEQLNGIIRILILPWHHDKRWLLHSLNPVSKSKWTVQYLKPLEVIYIEGLGDRLLPITLSHYPMVEWEASYHKSVCLHGHSHGNHIKKTELELSLDVGVDPMGFWPVSLRMILDLLGKTNGNNS